MKEHGICAKCKKSVGCPYADDRIKGCKKFVLEDELELTNEEWLEQASTEEKARFLEMICYSAWGDKNSRFKDMADYTDWMDWLKEKYHE